MVPLVRYNGGVTTEELAGPFTLRIAVRASVDQVRQAWTTPAGLEAFFIRQAEGASGESYQAGDQYRWEWAPGSELFVVYSDDRNTDPLGRPDNFKLRNRGFAIKVTSLLQL